MVATEHWISVDRVFKYLLLSFPSGWRGIEVKFREKESEKECIRFIRFGEHQVTFWEATISTVWTIWNNFNCKIWLIPFLFCLRSMKEISIDKERGEKQQEEEEEEQQWIIKQWERASISLIGWHESRDMGGVQSAAAGYGGSFELVGMIIIIVCVFFLR